jgi:hypothetical protein
MKAIDIDGELRDLVASEEVLAYFDFVLPLGTDAAGQIEGLCKVSRPRERNSRSTYLSLFFIVDAHDEASRRAIDTHIGRADWSASVPGVDCVLAIPHRDATAGLFLKEVDVYLDGSHPPTASFVRDVLQPAIARATGVRPGEVTAWEESPQSEAGRAGTATAPPGDTLFRRLRRLVSGGTS